MDNRLRPNEMCIVGMPRCDFVFSSARTCFIAYGFQDSPLEVSVLRKLLESRSVLAEEAGGSLAPAQNAFCAKVCSRIITAQFCIVLINNDEVDGREVPNANVNMEYGLMLGFNKYIIPFQRASQKLPFNVAGLDTIKYGGPHFERLATEAIDQAIAATQRDALQTITPDQILPAFLLTQRALFTSCGVQAERDLSDLGAPLGFRLLNDFSGLNYMYFGNFTDLRPEIAVLRLQILRDILDTRRGSLPTRVALGAATPEQARHADDLLNKIQVWIVLCSDDAKAAVQAEICTPPVGYNVQVFSLADVHSGLTKLAGGSGTKAAEPDRAG